MKNIKIFFTLSQSHSEVLAKDGCGVWIRMKFLFMAAGLGLEPRYSAPKADVLPLDDPAAINRNGLLYF